LSVDLHVEVDGIGRFIFAQRTMRSEMRISAEYSRLVDGVDTPVQFLRVTADAMATLKVLTVEAPEGWDLEAMDPLDEQSYLKLLQVHSALREQEEIFRGKSRQGVKTSGESDGGDAGTVVSKDVQATAD